MTGLFTASGRSRGSRGVVHGLLVVGLTAGCRADAPVGPPTPVRSEAITFVPAAELDDSRVTEDGRIVVGERTVGYQVHAAVRLILQDLEDPGFEQKAEDLLEIVRRIANDRGAAAAMLLTADTRSIDAVQDAARRALESSSGQPCQGSFKGVGARTRAAAAPVVSSRPAP